MEYRPMPQHAMPFVARTMTTYDKIVSKARA